MRLKNISLSSFVLLVCFILFLGSCTDVIEVGTEPAPEELVVDAWLNDQLKEQIITLTVSQPYFENAATPGATGATVMVVNDKGDSFSFEDQGGGQYSWTPGVQNELGEVGTTFTLNITWNGADYSATSIMNPSPVVDSISQEFRDDELGGPDGIYTQFFARDFIGRGNTYWIKTFKNGVFLNKPSEMNIAFDAGFDPGSGVDGLIFIPPIRELVNRVPDPDTEDDDDVAPWAPGDVMGVEIHSITEEIFTFLDIARDQMNNGQNTIFAIPLANAKGNILNETTGVAGLGVFCVSQIQYLEKEIE